MKKISMLLTCAVAIQSILVSDEGMWPLNMVPKEQIAKTYGVVLDDEWLHHVQKSSLRLSSGGSASFVSPQGLLMTNHHVAAKPIYDLSTENQDLFEKGFYARGYDEELFCTNLYADQLINIQDVTLLVNQDLTDDMSFAERQEVRKEAIAQLAKKAQEETGLHPQVVTLYRGARYHLYLYKRYKDVRLVMAPERSIAYFGGDDENFEYPRHNLDVCFFRVYENNAPVHVDDYLRWSVSGPVEGEPLFVFGHPGRTERSLTAAHLEFLHDQRLPLTLQFIADRLAALRYFSQESEENRRIASQDIHSLSNSNKVFVATYACLKEGSIIKNKKNSEADLFQEVSNQPYLDLQQALSSLETYYQAYYVLELLSPGYCKYFGFAKHLVRLAEEKQKPNEKRLSEYRDSELATLEMKLLSSEPVYPKLERVLLVDSLSRLEKLLGSDHPALKCLLAGCSIEARADALISNTSLGQQEYRKRLFEHTVEVKESLDPFIILARALEPYARDLREKYDNEFSAVESENYALITEELFTRHGEAMYPDATFTLRLSLGVMKGYTDSGKSIAPTTVFETAFTKAANHNFQAPYALPKSWRDHEAIVDKATPFNFVSTNDIIGGNSGSPVINKEAEVVGLIFDGNSQSLAWDFAFDETQARAVSVHSQAIIEALEHIYDASELAREIQGEESKNR